MNTRSVVIFVTSGPETPRRCATPFEMASVAAAMDCEAEMIFQMDGALLLKKDVGEQLFTPGSNSALSELIEAAGRLGVKLSVCSAALKLHDMSEGDLIDSCDQVVGAAYMTDRGLEADLVLSY